MSVAHALLLHVLLFITMCQGRRGIGGGEQDWGYITVRPNAHMFWWLYYTTYNNISNYIDRPLIIWLQGGPGMPSSGYGNFIEIGSHNAAFHKREGSFVDSFNVLFIDNPVGVGYSYFSDNQTRVVKNGNEIGEDLFTFFQEFITVHHPEFKNVPLYVFGESYGGKMAVEFVYNLIQKEKTGNRKLCNLKGVALGDAYISPMEYLKHYAPLALHLGLVDKRGFTRIDELAKQIQLLINKKEFKKAADIESELTEFISNGTYGFDMYNFLSKTNSSNIPTFWQYASLLDDLMNNEIKTELNITANITWKFFEDSLYDYLKGDLLRSITHKVEAILNTDIKVIVYNGILDFLVNTAGTLSWLDKLNWSGKDDWYNATQTMLTVNEISEGYSKRVNNLVFYAVLRAGHSVPFDNLPAMNKILQEELLDS